MVRFRSPPIFLLIVIILTTFGLVYSVSISVLANSAVSPGSENVSPDLEIEVSNQTVMIGEHIVVDLKSSESREVHVQLRTAEGRVISSADDVDLETNEVNQLKFSTQSTRFDVYGGPGQYTVTVKDPNSGQFLSKSPLITVIEFDHEDIRDSIDITFPERLIVGEDIVLGLKTSESQHVDVQLRTEGGNVISGTRGGLELEADEVKELDFSTQSTNFGVFGGPGEYTVTVKDRDTGRFLGATPLITVVEFDHKNIPNSLKITHPQRVVIGEDVIIEIESSESREVGVQLRSEGGNSIVSTRGGVELTANEVNRVKFSTQSTTFGVFGGPGEYTVTVKDRNTGRFLGATPLITVDEFDPESDESSSNTQVVTPEVSNSQQERSTAIEAPQQRLTGPSKSAMENIATIHGIVPAAIGLMIGFLIGNTESKEIKASVLNMFVAFFGGGGLILWDQLDINAGFFIAIGALTVILGTILGLVVRNSDLKI